MIHATSLRLAFVLSAFFMGQMANAMMLLPQPIPGSPSTQVSNCVPPNVTTPGPFDLGQVNLSVSRVNGATSYWMEVYSVNSNGTFTYVGGSPQEPGSLSLNLKGGAYKLQYGSHCGTASSPLLDYSFTVSPCGIPKFTSPGPFAAGVVPLTVSSVPNALDYWMEVYQVNPSGTLSFVGGQPKNTNPALALNLAGGNYKIQYGSTCAAGSSPLVEQPFTVSSCTNSQVTTNGPFKAGLVNLSISQQPTATSYWMEVYSVNSNGTYRYVGGQTIGSNAIALNLPAGQYKLQYSAQCTYSSTPFQNYFFTVGQ